jgi:hypothetical protein
MSVEQFFLRLKWEIHQLDEALRQDLAEPLPPSGAREGAGELLPSRVEVLRDHELTHHHGHGQLDTDLLDAMTEAHQLGYGPLVLATLERAREARNALVQAALSLIDGEPRGRWDAAREECFRAVEEVRRWAVRFRQLAGSRDQEPAPASAQPVPSDTLQCAFQAARDLARYCFRIQALAYGTDGPTIINPPRIMRADPEDWPRHARHELAALSRFCAEAQPRVSAALALLEPVSEVDKVGLASGLSTHHAVLRWAQQLAALSGQEWGEIRKVLTSVPLIDAGMIETKLAKEWQKAEPDGDREQAMSANQRPIRAGQAFLRRLQEQPDLMQACRRLEAWGKALASPDLAPERAKLAEAEDAMRQELAAAGLAPPKTLEAWEHLARVVELAGRGRPAETTGPLTAAEIYDEALAWIDREKARLKLARRVEATADPASLLRRTFETVPHNIRLAAPAGAQAIQTVIDQLWENCERLLPGAELPPRPHVLSEATASAAVAELWLAMPAAVGSRALADPAMRDTLPPDLVSAADLASECARQAHLLRALLPVADYDNWAATVARTTIERLELRLIDDAAAAISLVSDELSATRQDLARFRGDARRNAHQIALAYARDTLSQIWRAVPQPVPPFVPNGWQEPKTAELFLASRERVAQHFRKLPRPETSPVEPVEEEIYQEAARVAGRRREVERQAAVPPAVAQSESLTPEQGAVLLALEARHPSTVLQVDLGAMDLMTMEGQSMSLDRKTIGRCLKVLRDRGLANRPYGERKGDVITEAGRKLLASRRPAR